MLENIIIDAVNYRIKETNSVIVLNGQECGAIVEYGKALITIRKDEGLGEGVKAKTLMHEIIHAILHERGMAEESENETLVNELAAGIVNLIRCNPELVAFIAHFGATDSNSNNLITEQSKKIICKVKFVLDTPDTWDEMQRLIDEAAKVIDTAYGIDADFDDSPTSSELEITIISDSLEKIETIVKKIREACGESKHELHVKIHREISL